MGDTERVNTGLVRTAVGRTRDSEDRLSVTQTRALSWRALTGDENQTAVAEHAGVDESTVRYWLRNDGRFRELWERCVTSSESLIRHLRHAGRLKSLDTLIRAQDEAEQWSVRVDAAAKLLTSDRQDRAQEQEPDRMALSALLSKWARDSGELLGADSWAAVEGESRQRTAVVEGEGEAMGMVGERESGGGGVA